MKKQYIVLSESNHYGWVGGITTLTQAKQLLKIETEIFYIFSVCHANKNLWQIKIRYPFSEYYDCLSINEYKEEIFDNDDDFVIILYNVDTCDKNYLIVTHKP
jgi:hypothetical protein